MRKLVLDFVSNFINKYIYHVIGEGGNEPIIQMEYKKKLSKERKERRKNGLRKTFSFRPSTQRNGSLESKDIYRQGKRHSAVPSTFSDIYFQTPENSTLSTSTTTLQKHPITNGQPLFCDSNEKNKTQINHQVSSKSHRLSIDRSPTVTESRYKYHKLQKMFSLPYNSTTSHQERDSSKLSPYLENSSILSGS